METASNRDAYAEMVTQGETDRQRETETGVSLRPEEIVSKTEREASGQADQDFQAEQSHPMPETRERETIRKQSGNENSTAV